MLVYFGIAAGMLSCLAYLPYIFDTLSGRTSPQRASWLIWSVLGSVALASQVFEGATHSLWFAGVQVGGTILVFLLSILLGRGSYLDRHDYIVLFAAGIGLVLWHYTDTAAYALAISIGISLLGGSVTVVKAYRAPTSETMSTWAISGVAALCATISIGSMNWLMLAYPLYLLALNTAILAAMFLGRMEQGRTRQPAWAETLGA